MNHYVLSFRLGPDYYEIHMRGYTISRIVKYMGESQFPRECSLVDLPFSVQERVIKEITDYNTSD